MIDVKKKIIIFVGFLVLIVSLCFYGYFSNNDSDADNVISFNEFIKSDVIENNSKIIYEGKGINTVVYKGEYNEKNGDYENITNNMTSSLEPVTYQSTINTCYMYLRKYFGKDNKIQIVL